MLEERLLKVLKNKVSKGTIKRLVIYLYMILTGVRDAYLLDSCCLTAEQALLCCQTIAKFYELDSTVVVVLQLELDIIFTRRTVLLSLTNSCNSKQTSSKQLEDNEQSNLLNVNNFSCQQFPVLVSVAPIQIVSEEERINLLNEVSRYLSSISNLGTVDTISYSVSTSSAYSPIELPMLAGLLLGYPCLYVTVSGSSSSEVMTALMKWSVRATVEYTVSSPASSDAKNYSHVKKTTKKSGKNDYSSEEIDLMEFTIPCAILCSKSRTGSNLDNAVTIESVREYINCYCSRKTNVYTVLNSHERNSNLRFTKLYTEETQVEAAAIIL